MSIKRNGATGAGAAAGEARGVASLLLLVGGVFIWSAVPVTLIVFTGPKMAAEPGGLSMEAVSSCQAMYWVGWATSAVLLMPRIDQFGRRKPAYALLTLGLLAAYASTYITRAWSYAVCLFFMGLGLPVAGMIAYLLITESVPSWCKPAVSSSLNAGFSLCEALLAIFCQAAQQMDWRTETRLWYSPYALFLLLGVLFIRDPPRRAEGDGPEERAPVAEAGLALVLSPSRRACTVATCLCWSAASVSYYGLSYSAGNLSPDVYINMILLGLIDMVSYVAALGVIAPLGPRNAQMFSFSVAGCFLFTCGLLPAGSWAVMCCALVGRFFVNVAFTTCFLLLVTQFPVEIRSTVSGLANFFARLSSLAAPFCNLMPVWLCCSALCALVLMAAGATLAMPPDSKAVDCEVDDLAGPLLRIESQADAS